MLNNLTRAQSTKYALTAQSVLMSPGSTLSKEPSVASAAAASAVLPGSTKPIPPVASGKNDKIYLYDIETNKWKTETTKGKLPEFRSFFAYYYNGTISRVNR